jgi:hypothetical protein
VRPQSGRAAACNVEHNLFRPRLIHLGVTGRKLPKPKAGQIYYLRRNESLGWFDASIELQTIGVEV